MHSLVCTIQCMYLNGNMLVNKQTGFAIIWEKCISYVRLCDIDVDLCTHNMRTLICKIS